MSAKAVAKGLLTFVLPRSWHTHRTGGTDSARYCYSVFLRHLANNHAAGAPVHLRTVAELGPGDSFGVGLAALIAGAARYVACDIHPFATSARNVRIFDELAAMFAARAPIADEREIPGIQPALNTTTFPAYILGETQLATALEPERLAALRGSIDRPAGAENGAVSYVAPWFDPSLIEENSVDWILSQAVMEHVDDIALAYRCCFRWLRPGGVMSHQIDFRSHGLAAAWDGHRAYSNIVWRLVRGARPYLINRLPLSAHQRALQETGFEAVAHSLVATAPTLARHRLAAPFRTWPEQDLATSSAFLIHRKPIARMERGGSRG
jgi:SAM-dependent methyltransferase